MLFRQISQLFRSPHWPEITTLLVGWGGHMHLKWKVYIKT